MAYNRINDLISFWDEQQSRGGVSEASALEQLVSELEAIEAAAQEAEARVRTFAARARLTQARVSRLVAAVGGFGQEVVIS
jgi:hypothetical protein